MSWLEFGGRRHTLSYGKKSLEDLYCPSQQDTVNGILAQALGAEHGIELPVEMS